MDSELRRLAEAARSGEAADFERLVAHVRERARGDSEWLLATARADDPFVRRAFIQVLDVRINSRTLDVLSRLGDDPEADVRWELATAIGRSPLWQLDEVLHRLIRDDADRVRLAATRSAKSRVHFVQDLLDRLTDTDWQVRQAAAGALDIGTPAAVMPRLLTAIGQDSDGDVIEAAARSLETHFQRAGGWPPGAGWPKVPVLEEAHKRVTASIHPRLHHWLGDRVAHDVDLDKLRSFGTVLTLDAQDGRLPRAYGLDESVAAVRNLLLRDAPRAVVLLGESGTGKTALVHELAHTLKDDPAGPWHILRVSPAELLAGTVYIGEWQTKVRDLVAAIRSPKRVVLYVPNLDELTTAGRSSTTTSNVATALTPHIECGDVTILGECTPDAFREGLSGFSSLRRMFHAVDVPAAEREQTRQIVRHVRDELVADVPDPVLDRLIELADAYMVGTAQPGCAVGLLRRVLNAAAGQDRAVTERDLLETLSTSTGLPIDYLDDAVSLDRVKIREFFEARVMGQPEAVDAVMERVALIKSGLTDPARPFGVLFFVGPTGVGKTELARALAELLFGDANRMIRLDMSEFATYDAYERLLGWGTKPGVLTGPVRDQPFSLLLLDEIEKAHPNVFDLCLQLFDAGRLTDTSGRATDFRRTLIVLTSNVGATIPDSRSVGFDPRPARGGYDASTTAREMSRWFRPEFLNRLDRIVNFRPLDVETVEQIARREVTRVLERSGITRRRLSVDVDPAVLALLLKEGFSPTYGARPLKRTVEKLVLLPVAWSVSGGGVPAGSLLRITARAGRVHVEVHPPEQEDRPAPPQPASEFASLAERTAALRRRADDLRTQSGPLTARLEERIAESSRPGFYDNMPIARRVLDEIYRLDGVLKTLETLHKDVRDQSELAQRFRTSQRDLANVQRRVQGLEQQAEHVAFLVGCQDLRQLTDAFLTVTRVRGQGAGFDGVARLAKMYRGLARLRGFDCEIVDDRRDDQEDTLTLLVSGAGAHALLAGETGLHQFSMGVEKAKDEGRGKTVGRPKPSRPRTEREIVRVEVLPAPSDDEPFPADDLRIDAKGLSGVRGRLLEKPDLDVQIVHRPSRETVRAWTKGPKDRAREQLLPLLRARLQAASGDSQPLPIIRRYTLGPVPKVVDVRKGVSTGRLEQILKGHLDPLLTLRQ